MAEPETHLTQITITREGYIALRLKDQYSLHRIVYDLFDDIRTDLEKNSSVSANIVWKDAGINNNCRVLFVVTNRAPIPHRHYGIMRVESKIIPEAYISHDHYRFDLVVNPITRGGENGRGIMPVKGRENVRLWVRSNSEERWGFTIRQDTLDVGGTNVLSFKGKNAQTITLAQAKITGTLDVIDRIKFRDSFRMGVGRGKAFGCGMLQATPIIDTIY